MGQFAFGSRAAGHRRRVALLSASLVFCTALNVGAALAQAAINYSIPAGTLDGALTRFGIASGVQVLYDSSVTRGLRTSGVRGPLGSNAALARILAGTGLSYRFTGANSVTIGDASRSSVPVGTSADGSTVLSPITVIAGAGGNPADTPYLTPGSSSHISAEQLNRLPPTTTGDVFVGTPGVISAGNHVGTSINPNIRGLQGMGRVTTTVDGARQGTSSYRGYIGNRDEVYVDPDMLGGVDISKGPSSGAGVGGIGGTINFRTLEAKDIVKDGHEYGLRLKTDIGSNTISPPSTGTAASGDRPAFLNGDAWSGSVVAATTQENIDFIAAYSKRQNGNYFAGTKVPDGVVFSTVPTEATAAPRPGSEVFNTSQDTSSILAKLTLRFGDDQSLELGFNRYDSTYGEINELNFQPWVPSGQVQHDLSQTLVNTYTAKYRYQPQDNLLVDFKANAWLTDLNADSGTTKANGFGGYGDLSAGGDISNTSRFDTPLGALTWENGLEIVNENAKSSTLVSGTLHTSPAPIGVRTMESGYTKATLKPLDWVSLSAGARYDHYDSKGKDYLAVYPEHSGQRVSPNIGITLEPADGVQFYGLYTEGYRPPSLRESHWSYGYLLGVNPDLQPELAKNTEFGVNILKDSVFLPGDSLRLKAAIFSNNYENYIIRAPADGIINRYKWANIDAAHYRGVELSASYDTGKYFFDGSVTNYTTIEYCPTSDTCTPYAMGTDYGGSYVPPTYAGSITAGFRAFEDALTIGARLQFASERSGGKIINGGFSPPQVWPRYQVVDVFGSYDFGNDLKANVSVENLFDRYYIGALSSIGVAAPGRTFRASLVKTF